MKICFLWFFVINYSISCVIVDIKRYISIYYYNIDIYIDIFKFIFRVSNFISYKGWANLKKIILEIRFRISTNTGRKIETYRLQKLSQTRSSNPVLQKEKKEKEKEKLSSLHMTCN